MDRSLVGACVLNIYPHPEMVIYIARVYPFLANANAQKTIAGTVLS